MKKLTKLIYLSIVVLLAGCRGNGASMNMPSSPTLIQALTPPFPQATSSLIPSPSMTLSPSRTPVPTGTGTPTLTATPTIPPEAHLQFQCLEVAPLLPSNAQVAGIIVMQGKTIENGLYMNSGASLFDIATGKFIETSGPGETQFPYAVSPDRKHLVYLSYLKEGDDQRINLVIASADGQRLKTIPWKREEGWSTLVGWLNNEQLIINLGGLNSEYGSKADNLLVLNPFNGVWRVIMPDFIRFYAQPIQYWYGWSGRVYDPTLTRAAYIQLTEDGYPALALWDMQQHQVLNYLPYSLGIPQWSPDGSRLVVSVPTKWSNKSEELFLMDRDGQVEQLTNIGAYSGDTASLASWSPNGRYVAVWMATEQSLQSGQAELVIVDTETQQAINTCVPTTYAGIGLTVLATPVWSPDGTQLLLYDQNEETHHSRVILVDWVQGFAAQIAEDMEPIGWMLAP